MQTDLRTAKEMDSVIRAAILLLLSIPNEGPHLIWQHPGQAL